MKNNRLTRRGFIQKSALTTGATAVGSIGMTRNPGTKGSNNKLPREVWMAAVSQMGLRSATPELMVEKVIELANKVAIYQPDILCLPEVSRHQMWKKCHHYLKGMH